MTENSKNRGVQAPEGAREWLKQMQNLSEQIQQQQQQQTLQQQAQQQQQSFQQMVQESMNTYMQMFNIPHSYLQEGMRLAQEDMPGTPREERSDEIRKTNRRSAGQSS